MQILDLTIQNNTKAYKDKNLIQQNAKDLLLEKIKKILEESNNDNERVHNTILINGKRGYGKSSFMLSMQKILQEKYNKELKIFDIIDPTIIESKENIFLLVLSKISELIEDCNRASDHTDEEYKDINNALKEVAKGLNSLDGVGENTPLSQSMWNEPEQILAEGIKNISGGAKLQDSFKNYLLKALKYLGIKAFIIVFDDIDTATNQGKIILELIRKYFTSPKLIVVLLGDIELYNLIIRDMQWKKMDPSFTLKYEKDKVPILYNAEIDTLVNQYMLKILKPENRIDLVTINSIKKDIKIITNNKDIKNNDLEEYIKNLVKDIFNEIGNKSKNFSQYILSQPIRTIISILKSYHDYYLNNKHILEDLEYILKNKLSNEYNHWELHRLLEALRDSNENKFYLMYKYFTLDRDDLRIEFIPNQEELDKNSLAILINSHVGYSVDGIQDICDYFVKFYMPIQFGCNYDFDAHSFKIVRYLNRDIRKNNDSKIYKGTIYITEKNIKVLSFDKNNSKQAILNILAVGLFKKNGLKNYLSIWNIFGFISDMASDNEVNLQRLLQIKSFHVDESIENKVNNINLLQENSYKTDELNNIFKVANLKDIKISNRQLSSIFTRIEYAIKYIDDTPERTVAKQLHRYIVAILNSFIIVILENYSNIDFNNALSYSDGNNKVYRNNFDVLIAEKEEYEWLYEFNTMPLFQLFLLPKNINVAESNIDKIISKYNVFSDLDKINLYTNIKISDNLKSLLKPVTLNLGTKSHTVLEKLKLGKEITLSELNTLIRGIQQTKVDIPDKEQIISDLAELKEE